MKRHGKVGVGVAWFIVVRQDQVRCSWVGIADAWIVPVSNGVANGVWALAHTPIFLNTLTPN